MISFLMRTRKWAGLTMYGECVCGEANAVLGQKCLGAQLSTSFTLTQTCVMGQC